MRSELNLLHTLEKLRSEHQLALAKEAQLISEQKRMEAWVQDLMESHQAKKQLLLEDSSSWNLPPNLGKGSSDCDDLLPDNVGATVNVGTKGLGPVLLMVL